MSNVYHVRAVNKDGKESNVDIHDTYVESLKEAKEFADLIKKSVNVRLLRLNYFNTPKWVLILTLIKNDYY